MTLLFESAWIRGMEFRNRIVRSATAECMAHANGEPKAPLADLYRDLAAGGVGLIITGHMFVHRTGKAHPGMTGIDDDRLLSSLSALVPAVHDAGGRIAVQINHAGRQTRDPSVADPVAPSEVKPTATSSGARALTIDEIEQLIAAYGQAAGRAKLAGFDAVQIHAAHGYLVSQFLSPLANRRTDEWGGSLENRLRFLERVAGAVRKAVGPEFPVLIKLGLRDEDETGLSIDDGLRIVGRLADFSIDAVEISGGIAGSRNFNIPAAIRPGENEAYFRPWAARVQQATDLPVLLVGGFRSLTRMEETLASGDAQFISLCRPLICEPDLAHRLQDGVQAASRCVSGNRCWPEKPGETIACRCIGA